MLTRRSALGWLAVGALFAAFPGEARASVARALELPELVRQSERVVVATALQSESRWETVGRARRIVTYTRLRVDETIHGDASETEIMVRTLGGKVGKVGQIVHGEALLLLHEPAVLFVGRAPDGIVGVAGMSQGHFPVRADANGTSRLFPSPRSFELQGAKGSAVERLTNRTLPEARELVKKAAGAR